MNIKLKSGLIVLAILGGFVLICITFSPEMFFTLIEYAQVKNLFNGILERGVLDIFLISQIHFFYPLVANKLQFELNKYFVKAWGNFIKFSIAFVILNRLVLALTVWGNALYTTDAIINGIVIDNYTIKETKWSRTYVIIQDRNTLDTHNFLCSEPGYFHVGTVVNTGIKRGLFNILYK